MRDQDVVLGIIHFQLRHALYPIVLLEFRYDFGRATGK